MSATSLHNFCSIIERFYLLACHRLAGKIWLRANYSPLNKTQLLTVARRQLIMKFRCVFQELGIVLPIIWEYVVQLL